MVEAPVVALLKIKKLKGAQAARLVVAIEIAGHVSVSAKLCLVPSGLGAHLSTTID